MSEATEIPENILLAVASATAYGLAYSYNSGYGNHFLIPPILISPSVGQILKAAGIVIIVLFSGLNALLTFASDFPSSETAIGRVKRLIIIVFVLSLVVAVTGYTKFFQIALITFGPASVVIFASFGLGYIYHRKIQTWEKRLIRREESLKKSYGKVYNLLAGEKRNKKITLLALSIIFLLFLSKVSGEKDASIQEEFYVMQGKPNYVVVSMEEETIILAGYDPKKHTITGEYQVLHLGDSSPWSLKRIHIGRLSTIK